MLEGWDRGTLSECDQRGSSILWGYVVVVVVDASRLGRGRKVWREEERKTKETWNPRTLEDGGIDSTQIPE